VPEIIDPAFLTGFSMQLLAFVIIYWLISIAIGLFAALRVHNTTDYAVASRALPFYVVTATVFATWFGSETVLGIPSEFLNNGLSGVVEDPFGASLCLILVGLFFAKPLYRLNLMTIGDYYRLRFGRTVELVTTVAIVISYLGWVAAQIKALGLVFYVLSDGGVSQDLGMMLGAASVLIYTLFGGMWSVAITDFIQMIVIVVGLLYIGWDVGERAGGVMHVIDHARAAGKFNFWPEFKLDAIVMFVGTWITMMLGSIPQQDVFQRVQSSASEGIAKWASVLGGSLYFVFAFIPMFLAYCAVLIAPDIVAKYSAEDTQLILPKLVKSDYVPLFAQIMFFGALLSAIKSCASATLLAPSITFSENFLRPILKVWKPGLTDRQFLRAMRVVVLLFTCGVTAFAMLSDQSIYDLVGNAYKVTLVVAFVPLVLGIYWKRSTTQGAVMSMALGLITWISLEVAAAQTVPPEWLGIWLPHLVGFLVALVAFVFFSWCPQMLKTPPIPTPESARQARLQEHGHPAAHRGAAHTQHMPRNP